MSRHSARAAGTGAAGTASGRSMRARSPRAVEALAYAGFRPLVSSPARAAAAAARLSRVDRLGPVDPGRGRLERPSLRDYDPAHPKRIRQRPLATSSRTGARRGRGGVGGRSLLMASSRWTQDDSGRGRSPGRRPDGPPQRGRPRRAGHVERRGHTPPERAPAARRPPHGLDRPRPHGEVRAAAEARRVPARGPPVLRARARPGLARRREAPRGGPRCGATTRSPAWGPSTR